jgi:ornithine decarboxylase
MLSDMRLAHAVQRLETPCLIMDLDRVADNYHRIQHAFPGAVVHYAIKANSHPEIIDRLASTGSHFEVASISEAQQLLHQGISPEHIICMHPIKSPRLLEYLCQHNITIMAVDSFEEVEKIARCAPGSNLVIRVSTPNEGSLWNLGGKFGFPAASVARLVEHIRAHNLIPYGLAFHVGSQCENPDNWLQALKICEQVWMEVEERGAQMRFLSLGGGLPVGYHYLVPSIEDIGALVMRALKASSFGQIPDLRLALEPGRALVADAGTLVTTVFGIARREAETWAYIEVGTYNGLVETLETGDPQFYPIEVEDPTRPKQRYHIGGPTCVTLDTPFKGVELPELRVGDRLYIRHAGAYTSVCASAFNGFDGPSTYFTHQLMP